jgi:hypothetical protein
MGRWGRRRKQLLDDLKEKRWYWKLKQEVLDHTLWRIRSGRSYGPVIRQMTEWWSYWAPVCTLLLYNPLNLSRYYAVPPGSTHRNFAPCVRAHSRTQHAHTIYARTCIRFSGSMYFGLFNYAVSSVAFLGRMIGWQWTANWKRCERYGHGLTWGTILAVSRGTVENSKTWKQVSRACRWRLNPEPLESQAEVVLSILNHPIVRLRHSVRCSNCRQEIGYPDSGFVSFVTLSIAEWRVQHLSTIPYRFLPRLCHTVLPLILHNPFISYYLDFANVQRCLSIFPIYLLKTIHALPV